VFEVCVASAPLVVPTESVAARLLASHVTVPPLTSVLLNASGIRPLAKTYSPSSVPWLTRSLPNASSCGWPSANVTWADPNLSTHSPYSGLS